VSPTVLPPPPVTRAWRPHLIFYRVNQELATRYLLLTSFITAVSLVALILPSLPRFSLELAQNLELNNTVKRALEMMTPALVYSSLSLALVVAIRATLLDMQIILSVSRSLCILAFVYVCCAATVLLRAEMAGWARALLLSLVLLGILGHLTGGLLYYWRRRSFGDVLVETSGLALFLALVAKPIMHAFTAEEAL
jgi:hypothetical protein